MILILARDVAPQLLEDVVRDAERLGWRSEVSRGEEQVVVALSGPGDPDALEAAMRQRPDVDVLPILDSSELRGLRQRRRMLAGLAGGLGALAAVGAGVPVVGFLLPPKGAFEDPGLVRAGSVAGWREQEAKKIDVLGRPVLVVRMAADRFFALSAICTHMDICQLEWSGERRELVCPCHGGAFDVYGNVVHGPPSIPLTTYPMERIGGDLYIRRETPGA
jgi:Rieske Fe-S protein